MRMLRLLLISGTCLALSGSLPAEDIRRHGPYHLGMPFFEFTDALRLQLAGNRMEMNPRAALYRTHAPLSAFRIWTFAPFIMNPRLSEEFVFNDGLLIGVITRERLKESPFEPRKSETRERKQEEERERSVEEFYNEAGAADPALIGTTGDEPVRLNESGREIRDRLFQRFGPGRTRRGRRGIAFAWRRDGVLLTYSLLRAGETSFLEKTMVSEPQRETVYSGAGDFRTNLEVNALNNRVFRTPPPGGQSATWESGEYPYQVGPCDGYAGPLDLFGCSLRIDFGKK